MSKQVPRIAYEKLVALHEACSRLTGTDAGPVVLVPRDVFDRIYIAAVEAVAAMAKYRQAAEAAEGGDA